jgi:hypothetical protein
MSDFQKDLEELRRLREAKFLKTTQKMVVKPEYNYNVRKDMIDYIKKVSKFEFMRERMDKIEKQELKSKFGKICIDDLEYLTELECNEFFITELFKSNSNEQVLSIVFNRTKFVNHGIIKEVLNKTKIQETFALDLIKEYTKTNKNLTQIITATNLLDSKFNSCIDFVMEIFYNPTNTPSISFEQLKLIYSKTEMTPDRFKFLVSICSNKSGYSRCEKSGMERSNIVLLKNLIRDVETKFKCKLDINLYN